MIRDPEPPGAEVRYPASVRAPWLVIAVVAGCGGGPAPGARPPAVDRAAAQRLLELREQRLREQPPSDEDFAATGLGAAGCPAAQPDCAADLERGCAGREHDRAYARVALQLLGGAVSPLWLAAQRCA